MKYKALATFLAFTSLVTLCNPCWADNARPIVTIDGLQLVKDSDLTLVYAQADVRLGQYSKIYLLEPYVAFKKNWQQTRKRYNPNTVTADDMAKMKTELSSLFTKVFSETLEQGGYQLAAERGEDVLLVKPAIINLDIVATDIPSATDVRTYSESAGEMTLYLELYDSVSDDLLAKALDRKEDRQTGYFRWQTRVTNRAAANRILQVWANVLKEGLDEARSTPSP